MNYLIFLVPAVIIAVLMAPLMPVFNKDRSKAEFKKRLCANLIVFVVVCVAATAYPLVPAFATSPESSEAGAEGEGEGEAVSQASSSSVGMAYIAAALSAGLACIGSGFAVAGAAPAAIGAFSEDPKNFGKSLIFVALGEGIALYGVLVAILILSYTRT